MLTVVHPDGSAEETKAITVDIVAVHGLNGDPKKTWTSKKNGVYWLKDCLPHDLDSARIMSFGYNAAAAFGRTTADVIDHSKNLLSSLINKREDDEEIDRPIIFIAHSLGGIVVKQVLFQARLDPLYKSICERTVGIVFFGTPHRGSEKAAYGKVLASVANAAMRQPSSRLLNALRTNSDSLMQLTSNFRFQLPRYQIVSFYEQRPMTMFSSLIVDKHSALLEVEGEEQIPVDANHSEMCKFDGRDNEVYEKVFKSLGRMLKGKDKIQKDGTCA